MFNLKKLLIICCVTFSSLFLTNLSSAAEIKYACDGWISFVLLNSDGQEEPKQYFLRINPDNTPKEIIRNSVLTAQNATTFDLSNQMLIFAKSKGKTPKTKDYVRSTGRVGFVQIICWRPEVDRDPDLSSLPKDNTERKANNISLPPSKPLPKKDDPSVRYFCTQRLVYYYLGQDPKEDQHVFVFDGGKDKNGKRNTYAGPITAAQSSIRKEALNIIKESSEGVNFMLIDDPSATCVQE